MNLFVQFFVILLSVLMAGSVLLLGFYLVCASLKRQGRSLDRLPSFFIIQNNEKHNDIPYNNRIRDKDVTIFEIALSEEADFTKHPNGSEIIESIRRT